jgi:hypothetical protein
VNRLLVAGSRWIAMFANSSNSPLVLEEKPVVLVVRLGPLIPRPCGVVVHSRAVRLEVHAKAGD